MPTERYITNVNGLLKEVPAIDESAGAIDGDKIPALGPAGVFHDSLMSREPVATSAGAASAGKLPYLNSEGRVDITMFSPNVEDNNIPALAAEAIQGSILASISDDSGTLKAGVATSASLAGAAHGFVKVDVAQGAQTKIFTEGEVTIPEGLRSLTYSPGMTLFLGQGADAGKPVGTPPSSGIMQRVGFPTAVDGNGKVSKFMFVYEDPIQIA